MTSEGKAGRAVILVVDDDRGNRELVRDALEAASYEVVLASGGNEGIEVLDRGGIDVVVLDVVMPDIDGLEVCRRIRSSRTSASLPVILVTAHYSRAERLKGIDAGASDFLRKPLDLTDLTLRVRNAVAAKRLHDQAVRDYERVLALETLRDNLVHMIVHDLRSPLTSMRSNLQLVEMDADGLLPDETLSIIRETIDATTMFTQMVSSILDVSRLEAGELPLDLEEQSLVEVTESALTLLGERASKVDVLCLGDRASARFDADLIRRVVVNIVSNALDFSTDDSRVEIVISSQLGKLRFACSDQGPGISAQARERIFDKFAQVDGGGSEAQRGPSSGLGLTFCKLAVEAHEGAIGVDSVVGSGSTFWFEVPGDGPTVPGLEVEDERDVAAHMSVSPSLAF